MSFHGKIDPLTEADIAKLTGADDQLAKLLSDYAKDQKDAMAAGNRAALGKDVPITAKINEAPVPPPWYVTPALVKEHYGAPPSPLKMVFDTAVHVALPEGSGALLGLLEDQKGALNYDLLAKQVSEGRVLNINELLRLYGNFRKALLVYKLLKRLIGGIVGSGNDDQVADYDPLAYIAQQLRERSPVLTGRWRDAHTLSADGNEVANAQAIATGDADIPAADVYVFSNPEPYSRKLEAGKTKAGRDFLVSVQNRIYERVGQDAASKFGDLAEITFGYVPGDYQLQRDQRVRRFKRGGGFSSSRPASDRRAGSTLELPAIRIKFH